MKNYRKTRGEQDAYGKYAKYGVILAITGTVWLCSTQPTFAAKALCGVCCQQGGCLTAFRRSDGLCECNGMVLPSGTFGGSCQGWGACINYNGTCQNKDGYCCNGIEGPAGSSCSDEKQACCRSWGYCTLEYDWRCSDLGGTSMGGGSACQGAQACCTDIAGSCVDSDLTCCGALLGGEPMGSGTSCDSPAGVCSNAIACCKPNHADGTELIKWCDNHPAYACLNDPDNMGSLLSLYDCDNPPCTCEGLEYFDPEQDGILNNDIDADEVIDDCDNCSPSNPDHHCDFATIDCANVGQEDTGVCVGASNGYSICNGLCTIYGGACQNDGVGDACDNCINKFNTDQTDTDNDGLGDVCDDCPTIASGPELGTCLNGYQASPQTCTNNFQCGNGGCCIMANTSTGGNGPCIFSQPNCDDDCVLDVDEDDCDGDGTPDDCDSDIDNDGIDNELDVCDYTPYGLTIFTASGHPLRGTSRYDVDGDCDVDEDDRDLVISSMSSLGCANGDDSKLEICACSATEDPAPPPPANE